MTRSVSQQTNQMQCEEVHHIQEGTGFTPSCPSPCRVTPCWSLGHNHIDLQIQYFFKMVSRKDDASWEGSRSSREPLGPQTWPLGTTQVTQLSPNKKKVGRKRYSPRPISLSWSPYGEPFLLRKAWKTFSLAWPMVSQSRTLTEIFRQTSALSFSGIFSKTTFNACKNTNRFPSLLGNYSLKGIHKRPACL